MNFAVLCPIETSARVCTWHFEKCNVINYLKVVQSMHVSQCCIVDTTKGTRNLCKDGRESGELTKAFDQHTMMYNLIVLNNSEETR